MVGMWLSVCVGLACASNPSQGATLLGAATDDVVQQLSHVDPAQGSEGATLLGMATDDVVQQDPQGSAVDGFVSDFEKAWATEVKAHRQQVVVSAVVWSCLLSLIAYFWHSSRVVKVFEEGKAYEQDSFNGEFKFGLLDCFSDLNMCCCGMCCPTIRWAETISYVPGLLSFWMAFALFLGFQMLAEVSSYFSQGAGLVGLALILMLTFYRQQMRKKFQMPHGTCSTWTLDCLSYCCCACCTIIQEARHVEAAVQSGHRMQDV